MEYEWDGYQEVHVFATTHEAVILGKWFEENRSVSFSAIEPGKFEVYFPNGEKKAATSSIIYVDCQEDEASLDLCAYVGSKRLEALGEEGYRTIGVAFKHQSPWK